MKNTFHILAATCTILTALLSTTVNAALVIPTNLNPGDAYRVIFTSSTARDGTSANIADYDAHIQALADTAGIGSGLTWKVIASTTSVSAIDHITNFASTNAGIPIYNQAGDLVASNIASLWSGLSSPITYDENGAVAHTGVWTGTDVDGTALVGYELGSNAPQVGLANTSTSLWLKWITSPNTELHSLYGISDTIVIPAVPIPTAIWLFVSGLIGLIGISKRKPQL